MPKSSCHSNHSGRCNCGCDCDCCCGCGCDCQCHSGKFVRRYRTAKEELAMLEEYRTNLENELQAVKERIQALKRK